MSTLRRLEKHLKMLQKGGMDEEMMSISKSFSGCPSSSGTSSTTTLSSVKSVSACASLEKKMQKANEPLSQTSSATTTGSSGSTTANNGQANATSSANTTGLDNVDKEIERANKELIKAKTKSFESLVKLITILIVKCSPLLLYLKLKYASCATSRLEIANMLSGYTYLGAEVQKLDCFDEHALYILAAMKRFNDVKAPISDESIYNLLSKTHYWAQLEPQLIEAYKHVGKEYIESTVKSMLNSAAVSIINRKYKITAINAALPGLQLYNDIISTLQLQTVAPNVYNTMDQIEKGTNPFPAVKGGGKKHLKKPHKK